MADQEVHRPGSRVRLSSPSNGLGEDHGRNRVRRTELRARPSWGGRILRLHHEKIQSVRSRPDIVRAADSPRSNPHTAGEGLRWIAHGFSALGLSDHEILDREFIVYDALYAECARRAT